MPAKTARMPAGRKTQGAQKTCRTTRHAQGEAGRRHESQAWSEGMRWKKMEARRPETESDLKK